MDTYKRISVITLSIIIAISMGYYGVKYSVERYGLGWTIFEIVSMFVFGVIIMTQRHSKIREFIGVSIFLVACAIIVTIVFDIKVFSGLGLLCLILFLSFIVLEVLFDERGRKKTSS